VGAVSTAREVRVMTTEQVQEVETARYTNIRVASRVMGWTQWVDLSEDCPFEPGVTYFADWGDRHGVGVYLPDGDGDVAFNFNPADDIADAWKVVEKFAVIEGQRRRLFNMRLRWAIEDRTGESCTEYEMVLRLKPVDICNAALGIIMNGD